MRAKGKISNASKERLHLKYRNKCTQSSNAPCQRHQEEKEGSSTSYFIVDHQISRVRGSYTKDPVLVGRCALNLSRTETSPSCGGWCLDD
ncbi:hypothetical protein TNCV_2090531 [Trichonephila clavipes]|nr:hypothetical protein TNCV_2090531 [Trichonephila clavipes]